MFADRCAKSVNSLVLAEKSVLFMTTRRLAPYSRGGVLKLALAESQV